MPRTATKNREKSTKIRTNNNQTHQSGTSQEKDMLTTRRFIRQGGAIGGIPVVRCGRYRKVGPAVRLDDLRWANGVTV